MKDPGNKKSFGWTPQEIRFFGKLDSPIKIQAYLNRIDYDPDYETRSPRWVIRESKAHCFEGAIFAAAALRMIGHKPLLLDLEASDNDDDHVLAIFKENGGWGAVAKSNFTVIRFREPVYRSLRELTMSYFDVFFNSICEKTMRRYSHPLNLTQFDRANWMTTDGELGYIGDRLNAIKHYRVLTRKMLQSLKKADPDLVKAGLLGAKKAGLYKPKRS
jgi:hypothetical protein